MGRRSDIDALHQVVARVVAGEPQVVEIYGETGMGKTRLLDELARTVEDHSLELVLGRAGDYPRTERFGIAEADEEIAAVITAMGADTEAHRVHRAVRQVLVRRARPPGLALLLDDVHLADEASQELLENLVLDLPAVPLLVAVTYQGHRVPPGLPGALARTRAAVTRLAPAPLDEDAVAELLPDLPVRRRRSLVAVTGGNPLYVDALALADERTLASLAAPDRSDPEDMPRRLRALLTSELRTLDDDKRLTAHAAAVAGDPAELDLVVGIVDRPESAVIEALDELVAIGVLHNVGPRFRFRHPLVRAAAYQSAGPAWRIAAHRRAEVHLRGRDGALALRAHHLSRAGAGDQEAAETLLEAAAAVMETAPACAADWLRTAVRMLPASHPRWSELVLLLARAVAVSDRPLESREILHDVLDSAGGQRREAVRLYALADRLLGRLDESRALLETELLAGGEGGGPLIVELAAAELLQGDLVACARHAREAVEDGLDHSDRGQVAAGTTLQGLAALLQGDVPSARERLAEAARSGRAG
ncbi:AAA family ATPase [Lentzea sp. NPDC051838]|uniref:ATP-binding protein n=1 Tax=Lentzea sp. NPDC051838 TaxID=3154849 RepID=UPI003430957D